MCFQARLEAIGPWVLRLLSRLVGTVINILTFQHSMALFYLHLYIMFKGPRHLPLSHRTHHEDYHKANSMTVQAEETDLHADPPLHSPSPNSYVSSASLPAPLRNRISAI